MNPGLKVLPQFGKHYKRELIFQLNRVEDDELVTLLEQLDVTYEVKKE